MSTSELTLASVLPAGPLNLGAAFEQIPTASRPSQLFVSDALIEACEHELRRALDIPLIDAMTGAWAAWLPVIEAIDKTKSTPDATELVEIGKHEVKAIEHPELSLEWNQMNVFKLRLDLEIVVVLKTAALRVRGGAIEFIRPGSAELKAVLKYHDHCLLPEWRIGKLDFQEAAPPPAQRKPS